VLGVDAVVLRVGANEFDKNDAGVVRDGRNQPVSVALNVEDDATVSENLELLNCALASAGVSQMARETSSDQARSGRSASG
jgi:hypothetical protein